MDFKLNREINVELNLVLIPLIMLWFVFSFFYYKGLFYNIPNGFKLLTIFDVIYNFKLLITLFVMVACSLVPIFYPTAFSIVQLRAFNLIVNAVAIIFSIFANKLSLAIDKASLFIGINPAYVLTVLKMIAMIAILVPFYWYLVSLLKSRKNLKSNIVISILLVLAIAWLCYMHGKLTYNAGADKEGKSNLQLVLISGASISIDLIASLDKGLLINDKKTNQIKIIGWEQVSFIDLHSPNYRM